MQQLQEQLAAATEASNRLGADKWEVLEAVSKVAASHSALERQARDVQRGQALLADRERELTAREALVEASRLVRPARPVPWPQRFTCEGCLHKCFAEV